MPDSDTAAPTAEELFARIQSAARDRRELRPLQSELRQQPDWRQDAAWMGAFALALRDDEAWAIALQLLMRGADLATYRLLVETLLESEDETRNETLLRHLRSGLRGRGHCAIVEGLSRTSGAQQERLARVFEGRARSMDRKEQRSLESFLRHAEGVDETLLRSLFGELLERRQGVIAAGIPDASITPDLGETSGVMGGDRIVGTITLGRAHHAVENTTAAVAGLLWAARACTEAPYATASEVGQWRTSSYEVLLAALPCPQVEVFFGERLAAADALAQSLLEWLVQGDGSVTPVIPDGAEARLDLEFLAGARGQVDPIFGSERLYLAAERRLIEHALHHTDDPDARLQEVAGWCLPTFHDQKFSSTRVGVPRSLGVLAERRATAQLRALYAAHTDALERAMVRPYRVRAELAASTPDFDALAALAGECAAAGYRYRSGASAAVGRLNLDALPGLIAAFTRATPEASRQALVAALVTVTGAQAAVLGHRALLPALWRLFLLALGQDPDNPLDIAAFRAASEGVDLSPEAEQVADLIWEAVQQLGFRAADLDAAELGQVAELHDMTARLRGWQEAVEAGDASAAGRISAEFEQALGGFLTALGKVRHPEVFAVFDATILPWLYDDLALGLVGALDRRVAAQEAVSFTEIAHLLRLFAHVSPGAEVQLGRDGGADAQDEDLVDYGAYRDKLLEHASTVLETVWTTYEAADGLPPLHVLIAASCIAEAATIAANEGLELSDAARQPFVLYAERTATAIADMTTAISGRIGALAEEIVERRNALLDEPAGQDPQAALIRSYGKLRDVVAELASDPAGVYLFLLDTILEQTPALQALVSTARLLDLVAQDKPEAELWSDSAAVSSDQRRVVNGLLGAEQIIAQADFQEPSPWDAEIERLRAQEKLHFLVSGYMIPRAEAGETGDKEPWDPFLLLDVYASSAGFVRRLLEEKVDDWRYGLPFIPDQRELYQELSDRLKQAVEKAWTSIVQLAFLRAALGNDGDNEAAAQVDNRLVEVVAALNKTIDDSREAFVDAEHDVADAGEVVVALLRVVEVAGDIASLAVGGPAVVLALKQAARMALKQCLKFGLKAAVTTFAREAVRGLLTQTAKTATQKILTAVASSLSFGAGLWNDYYEDGEISFSWSHLSNAVGLFCSWSDVLPGCDGGVFTFVGNTQAIVFNPPDLVLGAIETVTDVGALIGETRDALD